MTELHYREHQTTLALREDGDGRVLVGPLLPWGVEARVMDRGRLVVETFERGALADVDPARVPLTATHPRDAGTLPIGVTVELRDEADALHGAWRVSDTALGNEVLALARDGVPLGLSVGFMEVAGGSRWSPDRRRVTRTRAALDHVAVVRVAPPTPVPPSLAYGPPTRQQRPIRWRPWPGVCGSHERAAARLP
jgi:phage head maturation protease